jgi:hypothetical protein
MRYVDYVKLSEQYGSFLIAIGGVSITVLSIVSAVSPSPTEGGARSFLDAALILATVSCFIGAHMMAETAAFIIYFNERRKEQLPGNPAQGSPPQRWTLFDAITFGKRLFLLASTNIFIAVMLVLFALVLLPAAKVGTPNILYFVIFVLVGGGALIWMFLASKHRMPLPETESRKAIRVTACLSVAWLMFLIILSFFVPLSMKLLLPLIFLPSVVGTAVSLFYFALIFKKSDEALSAVDFEDGSKYLSPEVIPRDIKFFGLAVITSFASLVVAGLKIVLGGV